MWQFLIILLCLALNALIAASELAFVSLSKPHLRQLAASGEKGANRILAMRENPERVLSVLQLGQTFISIIAAAVGGIKVDSWASPFFSETLGLSPTLSSILAIVIFVIPYTLITVVISELLPKSLALRNPKWVIYRATGWINALSMALSPLIFLLERSTKWCARLFHRWIKKDDQVAGEWVLSGQLARPYMLNLARAEEKSLKDVMIPWRDVDTISIDMDMDLVESILLKTGHTRLPVLEGGRPVSLLHSKEFHAFQKKMDSNWNQILRPLIVFIPEVPLIPALRKLQSKRSHMGIVGSIEEPLGVVTIEDIVEEVVGEIYDEDDPTLPSGAQDT